MYPDINSLQRIITKLPCLDVLTATFNDAEGFVVGGAVRDALLGLPVTDIDLVFPYDPTASAKSFAEKVGGSWFWLDESRHQSRVVVARTADAPDFDFAPFRAASLGQDLIDRDFTINSIAVSLGDLYRQVNLIDPLCGQGDLADAVLRMSSASSFVKDPLRVLKGVRHTAALELAVEPGTLHAMHENVTGLYKVAPERIRQEVWKIFSHPNASLGVDVLSQTMVGNYLFGSFFSSLVPQLCANMDAFQGKLAEMCELYSPVGDWLDSEVEQGLSCRTLLVWTLLLVTLDRELPQRLADEWLLSRKAKSAISSLCTLNEGHMDKFSSMPLSTRAFTLWSDFMHLDPRLLLVALLLLPHGDQLQREQLLAWFKRIGSLENEPVNDLVNGNWLRDELGLEEGPEMARALRLVRHAEITGDVTDENAAKDFLRQHYTNMD